MDEIIEKAKKSSSIGTEKTWESKVYIKAGIDERVVLCTLFILVFIVVLCFRYFIKDYVINIWIVKDD